MARLFNPATPDFLRVETAVATAAPFTVALWARVNSIVDNSTVWWMGDKDFDAESWALIFRTTGKLRFRIADSIILNVEAPGTFGLNTWEHACAVEAGPSDHRVFLRGVGASTATGPRTPDGSDRTSIGRADDLTPDNAMRGDIAHVAMWSLALTDQEVASLAAGVSPLRMRRDALAAYWPVGGVQSPEPDIVGGLAMTVSGTPTKAEEPDGMWGPTVVAP